MTHSCGGSEAVPREDDVPPKLDLPSPTAPIERRAVHRPQYRATTTTRRSPIIIDHTVKGPQGLVDLPPAHLELVHAERHVHALGRPTPAFPRHLLRPHVLDLSW